MSNVKEKEASPLMEKPQPVPGQVPDFQPPPYSNLVGPQSQAYTPVPPSPTNSPYPKQIPTTQDTTVYDPMSQVTTDDGQPLPQSGLNTTYAPTTYDPVANLPPVNSESAPDQTVIVSAQSANSARRAKRCRYMKISSVIGTILVALGIGLRMYNRTQRHKHHEKVKVDDVSKRDIHYNWQPNNPETLRGELADPVIHEDDPNWQSDNRYRRIVDAQGIDDFKDYGFMGFKDRPLFDKLFKPEKSFRQRRDLEMKNKFDKNRIKLSTKKKKYYKAKKFAR